MSWQATSGRMPMGAQHGRGRFIRPKRASSANMMRKRRPRLAAARRAFLTALGNPFFKGVLSRDVAFGMKRTRHQLAPAVPDQKIVDRTVAGLVPDGLLEAALRSWMFSISPAPAALAKRANKAFSSATGMFSRMRPPLGLRLSALSPPWS